MTRDEQFVVVSERLIVVCRCFLTRCDILIQMGQFGIQHGGLNTIQTAVDTDHVVVIANHHAMVSDCPHPCIQCIVVGEYGTAVPVAAKVLGGEETGATDVTDRSCLFGLAIGEGVLCADGLTSILYYIQMMLLRQCHNRLHISALAEQMHRHDCFGLGGDSATDGLDIHVHRVPINIYHHRCQT